MMRQKPEWLRIRIRDGHEVDAMENLMEKLSLHTVCQEAHCPNLMDCFHRRTATFMILGKQCTRRCVFCAVENGAPSPVVPEEAFAISSAVNELGLKHVVVTSVTRDDLSDGGAQHFARVITEISSNSNNVTIEVLIPDFNGDNRAVEKVIRAGPDIIGHNLETVPRLYSKVRPGADYHRSLAVLNQVKTMGTGIAVKSGIMVGLGEREHEVAAVLQDLALAGCELITIGQYLAPSNQHHPVLEYVHPNQFERYRIMASSIGFRGVASGPFVRSSYRADELWTG